MHRLITCLCVTWLLSAPALAAGSLRVAPTRLDLKLDKRATVLAVRNTGDAPTFLQIETKLWSQENGADVYSDANDLIVSPPVFSIDPGAEQIVRVARRTIDLPTQEKSYRLFVQEVPVASDAQQQQLNVVLRIGVPVFVTPPAASAPQIEWSLSCPPSGPQALRILNSGGRALRIDELSIRAAGADQVEHAVYVLAGAARSVPITNASTRAPQVAVLGKAREQELQGSASCQ